MPNINAPFGFRQVAGLGSSPTFEQVEVVISSTSGAIFFGDPVEPVADGGIIRGTAGAAIQIAGIFAGCKYLSVAQKRTVWGNYYPGAGDPVAGSLVGYIVNDPNAQFIVQGDATGFALADVNSTVNYAIGTGNTANGISGAYALNGAASTATFGFRVVSVVNFPPGAPGTLSNGQPYNWAVVAFNNVQTKSSAGPGI